jgi:alpha-beta hydrolase superfamily lysophospholipase
VIATTTALVVLAVVVAANLAWFGASRWYQSRRLPDECTIRAFQAATLRSLGIDPNVQRRVEEDYVDSAGRCIHVDVLVGEPGAPTIVFVPGTAAYARIYLEFLVALNDRGFNVVGMDPRGHGRSSTPRGHFTLDDIVTDALAVARYARDRFKGRIGIAGSSQGGIAALYVAARGEVVSSALCHNLADLNGRDNLLLSRFRPPAWAIPLLMPIATLYARFSFPLSLYLDFKSQMLKNGQDAATYLRNDPLATVFYTIRVLISLYRTRLARPVEEITTPIMVLHSALDAVFPQSYVEGIYNRLTCEKEFVLLPDLPHLILVNNVPLVIGPVAGWFNRTLRGG